jgi:hypothetical protein
VVQSAIAVAERGPVAPAAVTGIGDDLLELFGWVSDGRSDQGRDHPVAAVLALAAAAVVAGMKGYTAISGWVRDVPPPRAGGPVHAGRCPPGAAAVEGDDLAGDHRR